MGRLYDRTARDLKLKNLAPRTQERYLACCKRFAAFHMRSPEEMGLEEAKEFLAHLVDSGSSPEAIKLNVAGLKFLYGVTLGRPEVADGLPWPKVPHKKPDILSGSEVDMIFAGLTSLVAAMVLMTAYGAGLRISEACGLRPGDIDSRRGLIHVRLGKGGRDRYAMLPERLLRALRGYWVKVHPQGDWLFPSSRSGSHVSQKTVNARLKEAVAKARLDKHVTAHTLRHSFATHLHELGTDIRVIQVLLGHASIRTTTRYVQVSAKHVASVKSPLDVLGTQQAAPLG